MRTHDRSSRAGPSPLVSPVHDPRDQTHLAGALAAAFLAGAWSEDALVARAGQAVAPTPRWIRRIAASVLAAYHRPPADRPRELAAYIRLAIGKLREPPTTDRPRVRRWLLSEERMGRRPWPVAELETTADLAELLGLDLPRLDWLATCADWNARSPPSSCATTATCGCRARERRHVRLSGPSRC
jgi:hypothetical protein